MARHLVTIQTVSSIHPIKDADRIETARILGWTVVVGKDQHLRPGDKVAYFETDSLLPQDDPRYTEFMKRGVKTMRLDDGTTVTGHVLKTMRLRGVWSQGLIMRLDALGVDPASPAGTDITAQAGVIEWREPLPVNAGHIIGPWNAPCAKSDAPRAQTLTAHWDELESLDATPTVKVDGTSTTLYRSPDGRVHVFSRNWEIDPESSNMTVARRAGLTDALEPGMACQFELCGPGVQSNRLGLTDLRPFVFAVWRGGVKQDRDRWPDVMRARSAPVLGGEWRLHGPLDDMIAAVATLRGAITRDRWDEGVVWHVADGQALSDGLADALGANRCFKIISNKYLLKHGL